MSLVLKKVYGPLGIKTELKKMREIIPMEKRMVYGPLGIKMVEKAQKEIGSRESPMAQLLSGMEMEINP